MAPTRKSANEPRRKSERLQLSKAIKESKKDTKIISKRKRFYRPKQRKNCHLFKLPGEIRNEIYTYALVEPPGACGHNRAVKITPKGPGEPALLRVCKGIRNETRSIYYNSNQFSLSVRDYDGAAFTPFWRQYVSHRRPWTGKDTKPNISFLFLGLPNFDNLVRWLKDYHTHATGLKPNLQEPDSRDDYIIEAAFRIDAEMPWSGWTSVEKALRAFQYGLKGTCSRWAEVEDEDEDARH